MSAPCAFVGHPTDGVGASRAHAQRWLRVLNKALERDTWGQALEAADIYEDVLKIMSPGALAELRLSVDERSIVAKSRAIVRDRITGITSTSSAAIKVGDVQKAQKAIEALFTGKPLDFDLKVASGTNVFTDAKKGGAGASAAGGEDDQVVAADDGKKKGTLLPAPSDVFPGSKTMTVRIRSVGLKDASTYIDPFVTVSLVFDGKPIESPQDTPPSYTVDGKHVIFDQEVHIQTPVSSMGKNHTLFFEFKHYKPRKKKISTRCFTFMEYDEILQSEKTPEMSLELYKKPTDFRKKRINLFSVKKLYFNVTVIVQKH